MESSNLPPLEPLSPIFHPKTLWNQDTANVTLKIQLSGVKSISLRITSKQALFWTDHEGKRYVLLLSFYDEVFPAESKHSIFGDHVELVLQKLKAVKWPRLIESTRKVPYLIPELELADDQEDDQLPDSFSQIWKKLNLCPSEHIDHHGMCLPGGLESSDSDSDGKDDRAAEENDGSDSSSHSDQEDELA